MLYIFILYRNTRRHINNMSPEKKTTFVMAIHGKRHGCSSHIDNRYTRTPQQLCHSDEQSNLSKPILLLNVTMYCITFIIINSKQV